MNYREKVELAGNPSTQLQFLKNFLKINLNVFGMLFLISKS